MLKGTIKENEVVYKFAVLRKNTDGTFSSFSKSDCNCGANHQLKCKCEVKYIASAYVAKDAKKREITINEPTDIFGISAEADYKGQPELIISGKVTEPKLADDDVIYIKMTERVE